MKFIEAAKRFLESASVKSQQFADKEHQLRSKLTELEAKKSKLISAYDPAQPFDAKSLDKIDAEVSAIQKELAVLSKVKAETPEHDIDESIEHISKVKSEALVVIAEKVKAEEAARTKIAEAKKAFLQAQADHFRIVRDAQDFQTDTNETLSELSKDIKRKSDNLRGKAHSLDLEMYRHAGTTTFNVLQSNQSQMDDIQAEVNEIRTEINRLQALAATVETGISPLDNFRNGNGKTTYFIHSDEQFDAANKGIAPKENL